MSTSIVLGTVLHATWMVDDVTSEGESASCESADALQTSQCCFIAAVEQSTFDPIATSLGRTVADGAGVATIGDPNSSTPPMTIATPTVAAAKTYGARPNRRRGPETRRGGEACGSD